MGRPGSVLLTLLLAVLAPHSAMALVSFDFETPYLVHETRQVWDFCIVPHQGEYHAFYHTVPQQDLHAANADTIWHAVSTDLRRWRIRFLEKQAVGRFANPIAWKELYASRWLGFRGIVLFTGFVCLASIPVWIATLSHWRNLWLHQIVLESPGG